MKRHGKTRGELTIKPTNYNRKGRNFCQVSSAKPPTWFDSHFNCWGLLWHFLHLIIFLLLLHWSNKWGIFSVTRVVHSVFLSCPGLRAGAGLHLGLCGIFVKMHSEETEILKNCLVISTTTQLRAEPEGNNTQWESKTHLKILKGKAERGKEKKNLYFSSEIKQSCSLTWVGCSAQVPARQLCLELAKTQALCCPTFTPMCKIFQGAVEWELSCALLTAPPND